jgi:hypothetical protein
MSTRLSFAAQPWADYRNSHIPRRHTGRHLAILTERKSARFASAPTFEQVKHPVASFSVDAHHFIKFLASEFFWRESRNA